MEIEKKIEKNFFETFWCNFSRKKFKVEIKTKQSQTIFKKIE